MMIFALTLLATSATPLPPVEISIPTPVSSAEGAQVVDIVRVIDGDTYVFATPWDPFKLVWKVRVRGIDTPEKGALAKCKLEKARSKKAMALATELITKSQGHVVLRDYDWDKYGGRIDAIVTTSDGQSIGDALIAAGLARPYNGAGPKPNWCK